MNKKTLLGLAVASTLSVASMHSHAISTNPEQPNIIFINVDDLGWTDAGFMGSDYYETPRLDQLAKEGIMFTDAYAPAANCAPSRASTLTGQYMPRHGVYTVGSTAQGPEKHRKLIPVENTKVISDDNITFASILQDAGYRTGTFGKWHVTENPLKNGFDVNVAGSTWGRPKNGFFSPWDMPNIENGKDGEYLPERLTEAAVDFMKNSGDDPFLVYMPYYLVHTPIEAKPEVTQKYLNKQSTLDHDNATYAAMVEAMDDSVGELLDTIKEVGAEDNTLVVLTSDNGGLHWVSRQTPLRSGKGSYYEGGIRVPMIAKWPGKIEAGQVSHEPVTGVDLYPTFVEAANLAIPEDKVIDGDSLLPLMAEGKEMKERSVFWHYPIYLRNNGTQGQRDEVFRTRPGSAVRKGDWKLHLLYENNTYELYNLANDLSENKNLASENPEKLAEMKAELEYWLKETNAPIPTELNPKYNP